VGKKDAYSQGVSGEHSWKGSKFQKIGKIV